MHFLLLQKGFFLDDHAKVVNSVDLPGSKFCRNIAGGSRHFSSDLSLSDTFALFQLLPAGVRLILVLGQVKKEVVAEAALGGFDPPSPVPGQVLPMSRGKGEPLGAVRAPQSGPILVGCFGRLLLWCPAFAPLGVVLQGREGLAHPCALRTSVRSRRFRDLLLSDPVLHQHVDAQGEADLLADRALLGLRPFLVVADVLFQRAPAVEGAWAVGAAQNAFLVLCHVLGQDRLVTKLPSANWALVPFPEVTCQRFWCVECSPAKLARRFRVWHVSLLPFSWLDIGPFQLQNVPHGEALQALHCDSVEPVVKTYFPVEDSRVRPQRPRSGEGPEAHGAAHVAVFKAWKDLVGCILGRVFPFHVLWRLVQAAQGPRLRVEHVSSHTSKGHCLLVAIKIQKRPSSAVPSVEAGKPKM